MRYLNDIAYSNNKDGIYELREGDFLFRIVLNVKQLKNSYPK